MSHELFGSAADGRDSARPRRGSVLGASALAHGAVFAGAVLVQMLAPGRLPSPAQRALAYVDTSPSIRRADFPLPAERRSQAHTSPDSNPPKVAAPVPAPVDQPAGINPEAATAPTGIPGSAIVVRSGIEDGGTGVVDGVGVSTVPTAPPVQSPIRLHSGIRTPSKIVHVPPVYPEIARASHVQGVVIIEATIDPQGHVQATRVVKSVALLDQAALEAVRQWKFTPTLLNGTAVPIVMTITVNFTLER